MRYLIILSCFIPHLLAAQSIQWAAVVFDKSSELALAKNRGQYVAKEVLGSPSVIAESCKGTPCAWTPKSKSNGDGEFIKVGYKTPQKVKQITVSEAFNPGAIEKIVAYGSKGEVRLIFEQTPELSKENKDRKGKLTKFVLEEQTDFLVSAIQLQLNTRMVYGYNQIDAIGISEEEVDYQVEVQTVAGADEVDDPVNLGANINSPTDELAPLISPDGQLLYYTRQNHPDNLGDKGNQDVWCAKLGEDGQFLPAENIGAPINNERNNSICSVTPDGQTLLVLNVYKKDGGSSKGLSFSHKEGADRWSFPEALEIEDYYNHNKFGEYSLANDGKTLILAIERDDSEGAKDIYVSFRNEDGSWTAPLHTGEVLNTAASELSPYLAADGKTLYFATSGWPGYGQADMFMSRRLDDSWTNWSEPLNLGPKLNTPDFDAYYSLPASGEYAFFSSSENSLGKTDIMKVQLPEAARPEAVLLVRGRVFNALDSTPLAASVQYESLGKEGPSGIARSNPQTGAYSLVLPSGTNYGFLAQKEKFLSESKSIDLPKAVEYKEVLVDLYLHPIQKGAKIRLNNIFFDTNKYNLKEEGQKELDRLLALMAQYPEMKIEIGGHTDSRGSLVANQTLSNNRAKAVVDYLQEHGISAQRMKAKGYGENEPTASNETEEGRAFNRRIELKVLELD